MNRFTAATHGHPRQGMADAERITQGQGGGDTRTSYHVYRGISTTMMSANTSADNGILLIRVSGFGRITRDRGV